MSAGILQTAKLLSGASEGEFVKDGEAAFPQELDFLTLGIPPADFDPDGYRTSLTMETGKGLADGNPVSIPDPLILSQTMRGQSGLPLSPGFCCHAA